MLPMQSSVKWLNPPFDNKIAILEQDTFTLSEVTSKDENGSYNVNQVNSCPTSVLTAKQEQVKGHFLLNSCSTIDEGKINLGCCSLFCVGPYW